jgi:DNA-binding NtrC family response regulator
MLKNFFFKTIDKLFGTIPYRKINLYVVDDVIFYAKLVQINLEQYGYVNTKLFLNGEDVISSLKKDKTPDCIVLDHKLSDEGLNGKDVLNYVIANNPKVNVVILSGQEDVEVAASMMKQGAYDYIIKNDMALFNLKNTLTRLEDSINEKEKSKARDKKIKFLYLLLIILLWVMALVLIF